MKKIVGLLLAISFAVYIPLANAGLGDAFGSTSTLQSTATKAGFKTTTNIIGVASDVISVILSILGVIFIVLIIYSGLIWMTAGGSSQKVERASGMLKQAIIGLIIVVGAYGISYFFLNLFLNK